MADILIIGAGPAGLTAAIYGLRAGLSVTIFDKGFYGGQAAITPEIENYPAIPSITGPDFAQQLYEHAIQLGAELRFEEVQSLNLTGDEKIITSGSGNTSGKAVILANGVKRRILDCPGEAEFTGRGVSYCATCDGAFFKGKDVILVGGGNTALEDALFLSNLCHKVFIVHRKDSFRGEEVLAAAVKDRENIEILYQHEVLKIEGSLSVESVLVRQNQTGEERQISANGIFIAIGYEPDNALYGGQLELSNGYIKADETCTTNIPGVYAAGDNRTKLLRQIITAEADGAVSAFQAATYINSRKYGR